MNEHQIEMILARALPSLLVAEYGLTEPEWRELGSIRRISKGLASTLIGHVGGAQ